MRTHPVQLVSRREREARPAVPQIMQPDRVHPKVLDRPHELSVKVVGIERLAATIGEDEPARIDTQSRGLILLAA